MKRVFRTKSEKEQLVADFVESGMSKNSWCRKHGIPTSTLNNWLHHNSKKCRTDNENYSFMEISGMTNEINCKSNVQIEYDGFKITITELTDISFFKDVLKAVRSTDV